MNFKEIIKNKQDRLVAFFDAVLAIAITVLALEIAVPSLGNIDNFAREEFLVSFTCYLISFLAMGVVWFMHCNFFSTYSLTGSYSEIILHLVLLFVITLFQPMARAIGEYRNDGVVQMFYLLTFVAMNVLNIAIFMLVKHNNKKVDDKKAKRSDVFLKFIKENEKLTDERRNALLLLYATANREEALEYVKENIPDEYTEIIKEHEAARKQSFRIALIITIESILFISGAVVALMFSVYACYVILAVGVVAMISTHILLK